MIQEEETHEKTLSQIVSELSQLDDFAIQRICDGLKSKFKGRKGRVPGYEWMKKEKPAPSGRGKGRPEDSPEVKLAKLRAKMEQQEAELLGMIKTPSKKTSHRSA